MKFNVTELRNRAHEEISAIRKRYAEHRDSDYRAAVGEHSDHINDQRELAGRLRSLADHLDKRASNGFLVGRSWAAEQLTEGRGFNRATLDRLLGESDLQRLEARLVMPPENAEPTKSTPEGVRIGQLQDLLALLQLVEDDTVSTHALQQAGWTHKVPR